MQIISNIALITINGTLVIQIISFLALMFILRRIMIRPLSEVMEQRQGYINTLGNDIDDAKSQMEMISTQLKNREVSIRAEANELKKEMEASGTHRAAELLAAVKEQVSQLRSRTEKEIGDQLAEAKKFLKAESEALAFQIMEKILERRLSP
jgi:F-type H+-transporting ATPase subunit b